MTAVHQLINTLLPEHSIQRSDPAQQLVMLADGSQVRVWVYRQIAHARTVVTALQTIVDEPAVPQLWGADVHGRIMGQAAVVVSNPVGTPLSAGQGRIGHTQLHAIGVHLGEILGRVHLHQVGSFGRLGQPAPHTTWADSQRDALQAALATLQHAGVATAADADTIAQTVTPLLGADDAPPVLVCGDIDPDSVWIARTGNQWRISALTAWSSASGSRPVAEHVRLLDRFGHADWFSLRVGYGEAYDALTTRPADQLREAVLQPERILWQLRQAATAGQRGDRTRAHTLYQMVLRWSHALRDNTTSDPFNDHYEGINPA